MTTENENQNENKSADSPADTAGKKAAETTEAPSEPRLDLAAAMSNSMFAFRGYDVTNLGRTPELLEHAQYGPIVESFLKEATELYCDATGLSADLVQRVRDREETTLDCYGEAVALIVATELAQLKCLSEFFGIEYEQARSATGYSLGEVTALVAGGVYTMPTVLRPLLVLGKDTAELAQDVRMGVMFSRGPELDVAAVKRHCIRISAEGKGTVAISSYLSPNTVLIMGQGDTVKQFKATMKDAMPTKCHMRVNQHFWPPIHTPICRQRSIGDRAAVMLETVEGGFTEPTVPIMSCITDGDHDYNDYNSRELLVRWVDDPQRLWGVVRRMFRAGIETVIHVGPAPNIIPATLKRLSANVTDQLQSNSLTSYGLRAVSAIVRQPRPWLTNLLSDDAALLRAPFLNQVVLEDWLLDAPPAEK